jgi:hypothetical protein
LLKLVPIGSYAPPYRPDLKGIVEVLHRITKDKQHLWIPGAIDARRKEYELRRFDPRTAAFTVSEYVELLHILFAEYNLVADRSHRVDAHMKGAGVYPSPGGLWHWGHQVGIGVRRHVDPTALICDLLPSHDATVHRSGVRFAGLDYGADAVNSEQWTAHARNFGSWKIDAYHFPGSVSRIWTPHETGSGLLSLHLSEQSGASPELTFDEVLDAFMYENTKRADMQHTRVLQALQACQRVAKLRQQAQTLTGEALERYRGPLPTVREARVIEAFTNSASSQETSDPEGVTSEEETAYRDMMAKVFDAKDGGSA